jgi:hypothetical protein
MGITHEQIDKQVLQKASEDPFKIELGLVSLQLKLKMDSTESAMLAEALQLQKHKFDPYCQDAHIVKHHLSKIEDMLARSGEQLTNGFNRYDRKTQELSELAVDLAHMR